MNNKISVIVPIYNLEKYIERCVGSILNQTYKNIEIILVDDGSTDDSWKIILELVKQDNRIISVKKSNGGVTSARIAGIEKATGEWIGFVDGDDEIEADMYEVLLNNAIEYKADISHSGYRMCFSDGRVNYFYNTGKTLIQDTNKGICDLLEGSIVEPGLCNKLFRRSLFEKLLKEKKMPNDIRINEDLLMNFYLFSESKKSIFYDICKYHYIVRENSASRAKLNKHKIFDPIKVKKIILDQIDNELIVPAKKAYISTCIYVYNGLISESVREYKYEKKCVRKKICEEKKNFSILGKKVRILANLIYYIPCIYLMLYRFYAKILLKNKYV